MGVCKEKILKNPRFQMKGSVAKESWKKLRKESNGLLEAVKQEHIEAANELYEKWETFKEEVMVKPCHILTHCPYGPLVEKYPLWEEGNDDIEEEVKKRCTVFGHICPSFISAEPMADLSAGTREDFETETEYLIHTNPVYRQGFNKGSKEGFYSGLKEGRAEVKTTEKKEGKSIKARKKRTRSRGKG